MKTTPRLMALAERAKDSFAPGTYYRLPDFLTWEGLAERRRKWDIDPSHAPLASGPGVLAWGRLIASNYVHV